MRSSLKSDIFTKIIALAYSSIQVRESEPLNMNVWEDLRFKPLNYDPPASKPLAVASRAGRLARAA